MLFVGRVTCLRDNLSSRCRTIPITGKWTIEIDVIEGLAATLTSLMEDEKSLVKGKLFMICKPKKCRHFLLEI